MIILDASAAVEIARETEAGNRMAKLLATGESVMVPDIFYSEVGSSFAKYVKAGYIDEGSSCELLRRATDLVDFSVPTKSLYLEAYRESLRLGHPIYDMLYFVLARRRAVCLFTFDKRLRELCEQNGVDCVDELDVRGESWMLRTKTSDADKMLAPKAASLKLV